MENFSQRRPLVARAVAAVALMVGVSMSYGQTVIPQGPIRFIIPYSPGAGADILARTVGVTLGEKLGRPVVVDNRPGASTMLGTEAVARAASNSLNLLVTTNTMVINRALYPKANFDPLKDLTPLSLAGWVQFVLVTSPQSGLKTTADFIRVAKNSPGRLNYGSPGVGTVHHLAMEMLKVKTDTKVVHIPFSGSGPAVTGILGGQVDVMFLPMNFAAPQIRSGKLVALAMASEKRHPLLPDVKTLAEEGYKDMVTPAWFAVYGPPNMPADLVAKVNTELVDILRTGDVAKKLATQGVDAESSDPQTLKALGEKDAARWAQLIKQQGITAE